MLMGLIRQAGAAGGNRVKHPASITYRKLGLPVVVWGPEYCSAVQWARQSDRALCVTDPNPCVLRRALEELVALPSKQERLAKSAREAAAGEFNPELTQAQFMDVLRRGVHSRDGSNA